MSKMSTAAIEKKLECQSRARTRILDADDVKENFREIEEFLCREDVPEGTTVRTNWERVANCYKGIPEGTICTGTKGPGGEVDLRVTRTCKAFGNRRWSVQAPAGQKVCGSGVKSGATWNLNYVQFKPEED